MIWAVAAFAQDPAPVAGADVRMALFRALLVGVEGARDDEIRQLIGLSNSLEANDPEFAETLYWLGNELFSVGRTSEAREALSRGVRTGGCTPCRDLLELIELDDKAVRQIPVTFTFDTADHGVFHPWRVQDLGSIAVAHDVPSDPGLLWHTTLRMGQPDRLVFSLDHPTPAPEQLRMEVLSHEQDALLDIVVEDARGLEYSLAQPIEVPRGFPAKVEVDLTTLVPVDSGAPLDRAQMTLLYIVDRTGRRSSGTNQLWIDDIELR